MPGHIHKGGAGRRREPQRHADLRGGRAAHGARHRPVAPASASAATRSSAPTTSTRCELFNEDPGTEAIVMIGEIGGSAEEEAAAYVKAARQEAGGGLHRRARRRRPGRRMGHAGAIISGGKGTAAEKMKAMEAAGIRVVKSPADIGAAVERSCSRRSARRNENRDRANVLHHQARRREGGARRGDPVAPREGGLPRSWRCACAHLTRAEAEGFYHVHRERPFFAQPVRVHVLGALHHDGARARGRDRAAARDHGRHRPGQGRAGTIRKDFAASIEAQRDPRLGRARDRRASRSATSSRASSSSSGAR